MSKDALIIFVKNPVPGKVKTRLAADIGDQKALEIYEELVNRIRHVTDSMEVDSFLFYSDDVDANDQWDSSKYKKHLQADGGLGERMSGAMEQLFGAGYTRVILIGSDVYGLNTSIIDRAFRELHSNDVVLGPAEDGGYYLIGMRMLVQAPFTLSSWSHARVLEQTLTKLKEGGFTWELIDELRDIDTRADLKGTSLESLL